MRSLELSAETSQPPQAVWALLKDFGGVMKWAPGIRRSRLSGDLPAGVGARRVIRHRWGFGIEEVVTAWDDGRGYQFKLLQAPFPMRDVQEAWRTEDGDGRTIVHTSVTYGMRLGVIGAVLDAVLVKHLVAREMRAGLEALVQNGVSDPGAGDT